MKRQLAALASALIFGALAAGPARAAAGDYAIDSASASLSSYQAGAHADFTTGFALSTDAEGRPTAQTRDVAVTLPPGLLANPNAFPRCTMLQLGTDAADSKCPPDSQVGLIEVTLFERGGFREPIYNMTTPGGNVVARFGFFAGTYVTTINARVHPEDEYRVTASVEGASGAASLTDSTTTIWGVPASPIHDAERITVKEAFEHIGGPPGGRPSTLPPAPFLSNPTRCGLPLEVRLAADSYRSPEAVSTKSVAMPPVAGCGKLGFAPSFSAIPTNTEAAAPTGLDVDLKLPQDETAEGLATSHLRDARVLLPAGMSLAPGAADGLASCDALEAGYAASGPARCPDAAKIGGAEIDVPDLERPLRGAIYQRTPEAGHLFRIWLIADELGVHVALPGEIEVDKTTGQITSTFSENPQVPLREVKLSIFGGPRAPLATPAACGTYQTHWDLTPWSGTPDVFGDSAMTINSHCATGGFSPRLTAGTTNPLAGAFAPFLTALNSEAGEQNVSGLDVTLPPGLLAKLAGVGLCDGAAAQSGNCPPGSQIGTVAVAAGPGSNPLWLPQPGKSPTAVYLTGPYKGAPYGLAVKVPAKAGPFNLGTVVTRVALRIDSETAQVTAQSDPLPQILEGVPVSYRSIRVDLDRSSFTVNPTSCAPMAVSATVSAPAGAIARPSTAFQVGGCRDLAFKPKLSLHLEGGTRRGAHPALRAVLRMPPGGANLASAQVALPHSEFLDQAHIGTVCTRVQFAAGQCPARSIYGHATATSPLVDYAVQGPVYLRSSSHELPDLVIALRGPAGQPIEVDAVARIDSVNGGIRASFEATPDVPLSKIVLRMRGAKNGLLENSTNLCAGTNHATAKFGGQNGKALVLHPALQTSCAKAQRGRAGKR